MPKDNSTSNKYPSKLYNIEKHKKGRILDTQKLKHVL